MLAFSTRARYALRLMLDLSRQSNPSTPVRLQQISERTNISRRYLDQLVLPLKSAGLIRGRRGPQGGYDLARAPEDIRLDQIVEASLGPIALAPCVEDPDYCPRSEFCECRLVYLLLSRRLRQSLADFTLSDLSDRQRMDAIRKELALSDDDVNVRGTAPRGRNRSKRR